MSGGAPNTARLLVLGAIWGASFMFIEVALRGLAPLSIAALRVTLGALALLGVLWLRGGALPRGAGVWRLLVLVGFLNSAAPFFFIGWGQQHISSALSGVLMTTGPIVALLLAHFTTHDDRMNGAKVLGVSLGLAGVLILVGLDALAGLSGAVLGQLAVVLAAASYAASTVLARRIDGVGALAASALVLATAACYMLPLALWLDPPWRLDAGPAVWGAVLFLGLVPTALAYLVRFQLIQAVGATFIAQVAYLIPLFAVLWGWLLLDELPAERTWLALGLILSGVYFGRRGIRAGANAPAPRT